jgi:flagellin-like protein
LIHRVRHTLRVGERPWPRQRAAVSPIIATVLIIAVTLIAGMAIVGYVFGIFGSSSSTPEVSVTSANLAAASFPAGGPSGTLTCVTTNPTAPFLTLVNTGTAAGTVTGLTITWSGSTASWAAPAGCTIGAAGSASATLYTEFNAPRLGTAAAPGATFSGSVTLSNGANLLFTNTWQ